MEARHEPHGPSRPEWLATRRPAAGAARRGRAQRRLHRFARQLHGPDRTCGRPAEGGGGCPPRRRDRRASRGDAAAAVESPTCEPARSPAAAVPPRRHARPSAAVDSLAPIAVHDGAAVQQLAAAAVAPTHTASQPQVGRPSRPPHPTSDHRLADGRSRAGWIAQPAGGRACACSGQRRRAGARGGHLRLDRGLGGAPAAGRHASAPSRPRTLPRPRSRERPRRPRLAGRALPLADAVSGPTPPETAAGPQLTRRRGIVGSHRARGAGRDRCADAAGGEAGRRRAPRRGRAPRRTSRRRAAPRGRPRRRRPSTSRSRAAGRRGRAPRGAGGRGEGACRDHDQHVDRHAPGAGVGRPSCRCRAHSSHGRAPSRRRPCRRRTRRSRRPAPRRQPRRVAPRQPEQPLPTLAASSSAARAAEHGAAPLPRAVESTEAMLRLVAKRGIGAGEPVAAPGRARRDRGASCARPATASSPSVAADSSEAAKLLQHAEGDLRRALEDAGVRLLRLDISLEPRSARRQRPARRRGATAAVQRGERADATTATETDTTPETVVQLPNGVLVDVLA